MLIFQGEILHTSLLFLRSYAPFLNMEDGAYVCFTLNLGDTTLIEQEIKEKGSYVNVGTTSYSFLPDLSRCVVKSRNYRCLAEDSFSRVTICPSYLNQLNHDSFLRLNEVLYQLSRLRVLYLDMLVLHASAVVYQDEVLLFSGVKGAGKSTQAKLWLENTDAWILNYDKPVVSLCGDRIIVSGSPWGGKEDLSINEVRPAKALFFVHQAKENRVVRLSPAMAYSQAYLNYFVYPLNEDIEKRYQSAITQLIEQIPIYDLYCTDTAEAVHTVQDALYQREE